MQKDYALTPELFESRMTLIDAVFLGCQEMAYQGMKYGASWAEASIPFIVESIMRLSCDGRADWRIYV